MSKDMLETQLKIREQAMEMQDYLSDINKWENIIKEKEQKLRKTNKLEYNYATKIKSTNKIKKNELKEKIIGDYHTYDKGYKKWEEFNVDAALKEISESEESDQEKGNLGSSKIPINNIITPGDIGLGIAPAVVAEIATNPKIDDKPRYLSERESGNDYFSKGKFEDAFNSYTRSITYNPKDVIGYSNRAMCSLKLKNYEKAELDCNIALEMDSDHVKSLYRRSQAKVHLGKFRSAIDDLKKAIKLDPSNKSFNDQLQKYRESRKSCMRKTEKFSVPIEEGKIEIVHIGEINEGFDEID